LAAARDTVVRFRARSRAPRDEYFSDGVTDDIIAQLSRISALKVISWTSSMQYKKTTKKIARSRRSSAWGRSSKAASV
jgi:TolB-like protein